MRGRTILMLMLAGLLTVGTACKKKADESAEKAQAVESADKKAEGSEEKAEQAHEGAAKTLDKDKAAKSEAADQAVTAAVGKPAPGFELEDEAGKTHKLADYKGKIVVLEWTNPECPYVQRHKGEEKTMTKTHKALGGSEEIVWLAIDSSDFVKPEASKKSKKEWGFDHPVLQDPSGEVGKLYAAKTTPHMYVIDKEGVLRYKGAIDDDPRGKKAAKERTNYVSQAVQALQNGEELAKTETKAYGCSVKYDS